MKKIYGLINGKIIYKDSIIEDKVLIFNEKIIDIADLQNIDRYENINLIDVEGKFISPGFIDIHIHGAGGSDIMDGTMESITNISNTIAKTGVTGFLPTTMTMDKDTIYGALNVVRQAMYLDIQGAKVLGVHMEGPFINEKYKGAQNAKYILKPDFEFIKEYLDIIKIITLAPEMDKEYRFLQKIKEYSDITLSIGHSNATYDEAKKAIKNGIKHATHLFNAMTPMHHRAPGIVGAVLRSNITCELIADKIHVHPAIFQILIDVKGIENLVLITDSMRAGCMKDGIYELGGQKVIVKNGSARLEDNTLAGSILTLNRAVKNVLENTSIKLYEVVKLVTQNPAKVIGIEKDKGSLDIGKDADITVFDEDLNIYFTVVEGKIVFNKL
ncbi:N-acetylglucosamine-6-phosphate deacetylase [Caloranaerobacter azorensis DSM 13643]|uniref:N-acetylglucosamine-6-phosphate deacetylase n=1 Tax=Caloranaerobacter azorensis DSM 13643 TaxID=1121264 RepID=A0A1M5VIB6_9FIRM|nr:N-acetylglucosamine-6-phosphate deacetylase [Caloranaerobacter azorensis]SHH74824.1 N-acetylglucosamine-6-phosphate deacetylase [Caloranaerobacter azorensis DSM 13643]